MFQEFRSLPERRHLVPMPDGTVQTLFIPVLTQPATDVLIVVAEVREAAPEVYISDLE